MAELLNAAERGNLALVKSLLQNGFEDAALTHTSQEDQLETTLVGEHVIDVNLFDCNGNTALIFALKSRKSQ
eukprot:m.354849 g.354849  ORF g.354849 m.354849 type:complete len:72 (-) comp75602_c0_seq1:119-334(-)